VDYYIWHHPIGDREQTAKTAEWKTVMSWLDTFSGSPGRITIVCERPAQVVTQEEADRGGFCATHLWDRPCCDCSREGILA
jgi:hypothetical protein